MKNIFLSLAITLGIGFAGIMPSIAYASSPASKAEVCQGIGTITGTGSCDSLTSSKKSIDNIAALVLNLLSAIVGLIAVIFIIIGGMRYVTSAGNPQTTNDAKNTILYAIIGIFIVVLAQIIVKFLLHKVSIL